LNKQKDQILIVGSGIAGLTVALDLAREKWPSLIIEKDNQVGGHAARFNCKAVEGQCQKCGACLVEDAVKKVNGKTEIEVYKDTVLESLETEGDRFLVNLRKGEKEIKRPFRAVLLCHGFKPFDPALKPNLKYGKIPNLITGLALEQILRKRGKAVRPSDLKKPTTIGFVQCVGSRDSSLGSPYCSQVCCAYALRMARQIMARDPGVAITFFYMDIQTFGKDFNTLWPALRDEIDLIREIPGDFFRAPGDRVGITVETQDTIKDLTFDLMVLSVGMKPAPFQFEMKNTVNLEVGPEGFLSPYQRPGIFVIGSATGPMGITDTIAHSHASVNELIDYLENMK
jgi:heterodisulfide reductase subunit A